MSKKKRVGQCSTGIFLCFTAFSAQINSKLQYSSCKFEENHRQAGPAYLRCPHPVPAWEHCDTDGHPEGSPADIEAKFEISFLVCDERHFGHGTPLSSPIRRISENASPQSLHLNSYIGIT
jgi:hypothetical protein